MKIKVAATMDSGFLVVGKLVATAMTTIQVVIPVPLIVNSTRRPSRSMAAKAMNEQASFHNLSATVSRSRRLRLPNGDHHTELTDSKPKNDSSYDKLSECKRRGLQCLANEGKECSKQDRSATSPAVAQIGA